VHRFRPLRSCYNTVAASQLNPRSPALKDPFETKVEDYIQSVHREQ